MMIRFIIFFIIVIAILLSVHYWLYFSTVKFLEIEDNLARNYLAIFLILMPFIFAVSSIWAHQSENFLNRAMYLGSALWLGWLTYLSFAVLIVWLILALSGVFHFDFRPLVLILALFLASLALLVYGIYNAFHPKIRTLEISLKNLPAVWQNKTIVQLSDLHLGHIHRTGFMNKVVNQVNSIDHDLVVITGDLFDGMDGDLWEFVKPLNNLKAPLGVYYVYGNHETYLGLEKALSVVAMTKIKILSDEVVDLNGLQFIGLNYPMPGEKRNFENILSSLNLNPSQPKILLYHEPVLIDLAKKFGINLQLSGHTHNGQLFPFGYIAKWVYQGYDYGLRTEGDYTIYTTNGVGTWGPPMRLGNTPEIVQIKLK